MSRATAAPPFYDSAARRHRAVEAFVDLFRFRDLLFTLVGNSLKSRYKRSALGVAWTLLNPLVTMAVTTIAFSRVFRAQVQTYPVYVLSGLLLWSFFSQSTSVAMHRLVFEGGNLMKRIYLPRTIFSVAAVGTGAVNLLLGLIPLALIALIQGLRPTPALLFLPVSLLLTTAFVLGAALCLSALAIYFVDVIEIFQAAVMAMFYVTPVLYPAEIVPGRMGILLRVNPMTYLLETFRDPIHLGRLPSLETVLISTAIASVTLVVGWWLFTSRADAIVIRT